MNLISCQNFQECLKLILVLVMLSPMRAKRFKDLKENYALSKMPD